MLRDHHEAGTNDTLITQNPERERHTGHGVGLRSTGALTIRRRVNITWSPFSAVLRVLGLDQRGCASRADDRHDSTASLSPRRTSTCTARNARSRASCRVERACTPSAGCTSPACRMPHESNDFADWPQALRVLRCRRLLLRAPLARLLHRCASVRRS